jgi:hypothetical protein
MALLNTADLTGKALDWAVAKALGLPMELDPMGFGHGAPNSSEAGWWVWENAAGPAGTRYQLIGRDFSPSTLWAQGGPFIGILGMSLTAPSAGNDGRGTITRIAYWTAEVEGLIRMTGMTELVSICRLFVYARLGPKVEVPAELL